MILRFLPGATPAERAEVAAAVRRSGAACDERDGLLVLDEPLAADDAVAIAAMPGVAAIAPRAPDMATMGEALMLWVAGAATILGVLLLVACNVGSTIGQRADPLRTPGALRPSWPLLPWYAAESAVPPQVPIALLLCLAAVVLFLWPRLGRGLAEKRPALHAALGVASLLLVAALAAMEAMR